MVVMMVVGGASISAAMAMAVVGAFEAAAVRKGDICGAETEFRPRVRFNFGGAGGAGGEVGFSG